MLGQQYDWKRYWVPLNQNPTMRDGYFVEPSTSLEWLLQTSNGVRLTDLKNVPCLILLAGVGMGKSTVVRDEAKELSRTLEGQAHKVIYHDLKRLSEARIIKQVFDDPKLLGWKRGEYAITVFLDSLDECWRRIEELESVLMGGFGDCLEQKPPPFYLRLTCRSAEWRGSVGTKLMEMFGGQDKVQMYTLAPLSAENVRTAVVANAQDGDAFLARVGEIGVQPMAARPITFNMLLNIYLQGGKLPNSRVEIYERGCGHLCTEPNSEMTSRLQKQTLPIQRLAIASRLAALSVLTNRYVINGDPEHPLSRTDILEATDALGLFKEGEADNEIAVNRETVTETLQTGLFGERGDGGQIWNHQSYAEFLAARYLSASTIPTEQIVSLLSDTASNRKRLIPQLEETACWLAEMKPQLFDILGPPNADVFIRCSGNWLNDERKYRYVESYLKLVKDHEAENLDWGLKQQLANLNHPKLANQLEAVIRDKKENPLVRETAVDIAGFCHCTDLADAIVEVFLDTSEIERYRQHAGAALVNSATEQVRGLLKQKALRANLDDSQDEIKGIYLTLLWPSHLSTTELLSHLTPRRKRNHFGMYEGFLNELASTIPEGDLPLVLRWLGNDNVTFDMDEPFGVFPRDIVRGALKSCFTSEISDPLVELITKKGTAIRGVFRGGLQKPELSSAEREAFWKAIVHSDLKVQDLTLYGDIHDTGILSSADIKYFVNCFVNAQNETEKSKWYKLIFLAFSPTDSTALDLVSALAKQNQQVEKGLLPYISCPLVANENNWIKKNYERAREAESQKAYRKTPSYTELMEYYLREFENGKTFAFWHIIEHLQRDPDREFSSSLNLQVSKDKGWNLLLVELKSRILAASEEYFEVQAVDGEGVWTSGRGNGERRYTVANPAFLLLYDEAPAAIERISAEQWERWIPVIFQYHDWGNGSHNSGFEEIVRLAFLKAYGAAFSALKRFVNQNVNHDNKRRILWSLRKVWCGDIEQVLLTKINEGKLEEQAMRDLLQIFIENAPAKGKKLSEDVFSSRSSDSAWHIFVPLAGALLIQNWPADKADEFLGVIEADVVLGKRIAWKLVPRFGGRFNWATKFQPKQLARLWHFLEREFPGNPYDQETDGTVTAAHEMYHFRRGILESLRMLDTEEACQGVMDLMEKRPDLFWLGDILAEMRKRVRQSAWVRPEPKALLVAFADSNKCLIKTAGDLHYLLLKLLDEFKKTLQGPNPSTELWNSVSEGTNKIWDPKDENNLSDCLKRFLERELEKVGVIASREVQIRRRFGEDPAQLADLLVTAVPLTENGDFAKPVSVVIEVKCAWNQGIYKDMEAQLFDRYLGNQGQNFGIYAVAYFTCDTWNRTSDHRKTSNGSKDDIETLRAKLREQATKLSIGDKSVASFVIDGRIGR